MATVQNVSKKKEKEKYKILTPEEKNSNTEELIQRGIGSILKDENKNMPKIEDKALIRKAQKLKENDISFATTDENEKEKEEQNEEEMKEGEEGDFVTEEEVRRMEQEQEQNMNKEENNNNALLENNNPLENNPQEKLEEEERKNSVEEMNQPLRAQPNFYNEDMEFEEISQTLQTGKKKGKKKKLKEEVDTFDYIRKIFAENGESFRKPSIRQKEEEDQKRLATPKKKEPFKPNEVLQEFTFNKRLKEAQEEEKKQYEENTKYFKNYYDLRELEKFKKKYPKGQTMTYTHKKKVLSKLSTFSLQRSLSGSTIFNDESFVKMGREAKNILNRKIKKQKSESELKEELPEESPDKRISEPLINNYLNAATDNTKKKVEMDSTRKEGTINDITGNKSSSTEEPYFKKAKNTLNKADEVFHSEDVQQIINEKEEENKEKEKEKEKEKILPIKEEIKEENSKVEQHPEEEGEYLNEGNLDSIKVPSTLISDKIDTIEHINKPSSETELNQNKITPEIKQKLSNLSQAIIKYSTKINYDSLMDTLKGIKSLERMSDIIKENVKQNVMNDFKDFNNQKKVALLCNIIKLTYLPKYYQELIMNIAKGIYYVNLSEGLRVLKLIILFHCFNDFLHNVEYFINEKSEEEMRKINDGLSDLFNKIALPFKRVGFEELKENEEELKAEEERKYEFKDEEEEKLNEEEENINSDILLGTSGTAQRQLKDSSEEIKEEVKENPPEKDTFKNLRDLIKKQKMKVELNKSKSSLMSSFSECSSDNIEKRLNKTQFLNISTEEEKNNEKKPCLKIFKKLGKKKTPAKLNAASLLLSVKLNPKEDFKTPSDKKGKNLESVLENEGKRQPLMSKSSLQSQSAVSEADIPAEFDNNSAIVWEFSVPPNHNTNTSDDLNADSNKKEKDPLKEFDVSSPDKVEQNNEDSLMRKSSPITDMSRKDSNDDSSAIIDVKVPPEKENKEAIKASTNSEADYGDFIEEDIQEDNNNEDIMKDLAKENLSSISNVGSSAGGSIGTTMKSRNNPENNSEEKKENKEEPKERKIVSDSNGPEFELSGSIGSKGSERDKNKKGNRRYDKDYEGSEINMPKKTEEKTIKKRKIEEPEEEKKTEEKSTKKRKIEEPKEEEKEEPK
ncbi:MAG: hypothetical protein MJ252_09875, partial [archaeon]|nr:hypothetical protein [archaeon]